MIRTTSVAVAMLLSSGLTAPASASEVSAPAHRSATGITGSWQGAVISQDGPAGYRGKVRIRRTDDGYAARARYTADQDVIAKTRWRYRGRAHGWFVFRERMVGASDGSAATRVKVRRDGARLIVRWRDPSGYTGHMRARRV
ncbi:hypothetical protein [Nocardioides ferulae]|uniref:hypothetical protein n=1 Tax=Nocardioides ferulae TaxID=2340821 RepID=UPI000EB2D518|nr:hypothetical protein [Nocardioides ferulae]